MSVSFSQSYGLVTPAQVERIESLIGYKLPTDYAEFLLRVNGGRPSLDKFRITGHDTSKNSVVDAFFGVHEGRFNNLEKYYAMSRGRISEGVLPIAFDRAGNLLCLSLEGEKAGSVFFWDHEREDLVDDVSENLFFVANSFSDLLARMY